jgi:hypothetical protein
MEYWRGYVPGTYYPIDWQCEICNGSTLMWGFTHGHCRCTQCLVQYQFKAGTIPSVTIVPFDDFSPEVKTYTPIAPVSLLKDEFVEPFKKLWNEYAVTIEAVSMKTLEEVVKELQDATD